MATIPSLFCIDPGTKKSGIALIEQETIQNCFEVENDALFETICLWAEPKYHPKVIIEDMAIFMGCSAQQVVDTMKFIGVLEYRLKLAKIDYELVKRWKVKKWAYATYPDICTHRAEDKIRRLEQKTKSGEYRKPSFAYVDDRAIIEVMKRYWQLPTPKPGKSHGYGLTSTSHAWQALAAGVVYISRPSQKPESL